MILNKLRIMLKKVKQKRALKNYSKNISISEKAILMPNFGINFFEKTENRIYLEIGEKSLIDGQCIFEKESGNIKIGSRVHIGGGTNLISINSIEIGNDVTIAWDCTIYDHNSHSINWEERKNDTLTEINDLQKYGSIIKNKNWKVVKTAPIKIEDKVWIGFGVTILKGVTIGEGSVIGAKSVVTRDIPPYSLVGGNPAKVIKMIGKGDRDDK